MNNLQMFLIYVGLAIVLGLILRGSDSLTGLRRWLERKSNDRTDGLKHAVTIASMGTSEPAEKLSYGARYPASTGLKVVSTVLTAALLVVCYRMGGGTGMTPGADMAQSPLFMAAVLGMLYYLTFIWKYEIRTDGTLLVVPTWTMGRRMHDLGDLKRVESDGAYMYRLKFGTGQTVELFRHVKGADDLRQILRDRVQTEYWE